MPQLVTFQLENGPTVTFESDDALAVRPVMRGGHLPELLTESGTSLNNALESVKSAAQVMFDRLCSLSRPPDELTLEFGVKLSAEAGAVIAKAVTDAHFAVTMKWAKPANGGK